MKNLLLTVIFLFLSVFAIAPKEINNEFETKMNLAFQPHKKKRSPVGEHKDQAFGFRKGEM